MVLMVDFVHHDGDEGRRRFEELLAKRFPSIEAQIDEIERGLLHLEMGARKGQRESQRTPGRKWHSTVAIAGATKRPYRTKFHGATPEC